MKLKSFKEKDYKRTSVILFTIICILLLSGVILYRTFAIFEVKTNQNIINGKVQDMGDIEFAFYKDNTLVKNIPKKQEGYTLNTEKSKCVDMTTGNQSSNIFWDHEKWEAHLKNMTTTKTKCYLYFDKLYVDNTLNGAIPDLGNELVAITFNEENGHAKKASLTSEWYNYGEQKWANAVILKTKEDYEDGEEIPEENIESYFVWIPRYEYQIWNGENETNKFENIEKDLGVVEDATQREELNQQQKIKIQFVNKNVPIKIGTSQGNYMTHPAFTSFDSNGFWVGKFETGYNQEEDEENQVTPDTNWNSLQSNQDVIAPNKIIIKPNVYSWRSIRVANAFYTSYNYRRTLDSHMIKNMEWGAVAYLTNSQYGRCQNESCEEIRINNSANYVTGSSAVKQPTCGYTGSNDLCNKYEENILGQNTENINNYNNPASVVSSTTNNYYGIYDMSGGAWEYVMGVMLDREGNNASGRNNDYNSNFIGTLTYSTDGTNPSKTTWTKEDGGMAWPDKRYYDTYNYSDTDQNFYRGLFGDATKELGLFYLAKYRSTLNNIEIGKYLNSWYGDDAHIIFKEKPWIFRGGSHADGTDAGIFAFGNAFGEASSPYTFRIVLTP